MSGQEEIPVLLPPATYRAIEALTRKAIDYSGNNQQVRESVGALCLTLQQQSETRFGVVSTDVRLLQQLYRRSAPDYDIRNDRPYEIDPIEAMASENGRLSKDCVSAAQQIRRIWDSFGRFLVVSARSYQKGGKSGRSKPLQPMDVMGNDVYALWRQAYVPWYTSASRKVVYANNGMQYNEGVITLQVVLDYYPPRKVDEIRRLDRGVSFKILKRQLEEFSGC